MLSASAPDCEIVTSRIVNASIDQAFRAWSEPEHLKIWWGPHGFTNTFHEFDFREGGTWKFTMHGPEKGNYANECIFTRIEAPTFISWKRISKPLFNVVFTFEQKDTDKTLITFRQIFSTPEECNKIKPHVVDKNEENFDRLEAELMRMQTL